MRRRQCDIFIAGCGLRWGKNIFKYMGDIMLYICPTPIGNLEDITLRTLNTLKEVDEIYCEDTRRTIKLLNSYSIKKPLYSLHEHNETTKSREIIQKIKNGYKIAYVSDAGMPGISDPGQILIQQCLQEDIEVVTLPGPSAMLVALVNSGLDTKQFTFIGFLEREKKKQRKQLEELSKKKETLIIYEAPHRINQTIENMYVHFLNRKIVLAREISKKFEEYIRTDLESLNRNLQENIFKIQGEIVLIVAGTGKIEEKGETIRDEDIKNLLLEKRENGISNKDAIKQVSKELNINKNRVYTISNVL